jgi:hypothetical protein
VIWRLGVLLAASFSLTVAAAPSDATPSAPAASRIVDRATLENPNETPTRLPADETGFRPTAFTHWSLGLSAGTGPWTNDPALEKQEPFVSIWSKWEQACKPAPRGRVPLSPRGLQGGAAGLFGDWYTCSVPRRVLARIRAVFDSPVSFRLDHATATLKARAPVRAASFAVRTTAGKALAFASVNDAGKARVFVGANCTG